MRPTAWTGRSVAWARPLPLRERACATHLQTRTTHALRQAVAGKQRDDPENAATTPPATIAPVLPVKEEEAGGSVEEQDAGAAEVAAREEDGGGEEGDRESQAQHVMSSPGASQVSSQEGYPAGYSSSAPASQLRTQDYEEAASEDALQSTSQQPVLQLPREEEEEESSKGSGGAEVKIPGKRKRLQQADSSDEEETGEGTTAEEACGAAVGDASGNVVPREEEEEVDPTDWRERTKARFSCANLGFWLLRIEVHLFPACALK